MRNRWGIAAAAMGLHICIGSVYAWSVLTKPIMQALGVTLPQVTWTFSIAILFLGLSAAFLGSFVEQRGPRISGYISTGFFCIGMLGTALAIEWQSLPLLYVSYGVIGGIGLGVGYITPVSTLVKYFPDKRGFATGLAIMGFGFASLLAGPAMQYLVSQFGLVYNFIILAAVYAVLMGASASYLAPPSEEQQVLLAQTLLAKAKQNTVGEVRHLRPTKQFTVAEAVRDWKFYALWWVFFTNITCGIGLLAVASPMAQEVVKMTPVAAASMVGIIGLMNGFGRIMWSTISDYLGRRNTYIVFFALEVGAFALLAGTSTALAFQALSLLIVSCYGGGFSCMPAYLSDLFGVKSLSAIHGRILTAWSAAGIAGPLLLSVLREATNSYAACLYVFSALFVISLGVAIVLKWKTGGATLPVATSPTQVVK